MTREQRHWGAFPERFQRGAPGDSARSVHLLDLPGVGRARRRRCPTSIPKITDDLRARWTGGPGPWGILAVSMGGMIASDWACRYPQDFQRVVLINSSAGNLSPLPHRLRPEAIATLAKGLGRDALERERAILRATSSAHAQDESLAKTWADYHHNAPMRPTVAVAQLIAASRYKAPTALQTPVLVLASLFDGLTDRRCSERLAERYDAPLYLHPTAGHDLPLDDPDWIVDKVDHWLQSES